MENAQKEMEVLTINESVKNKRFFQLEVSSVPLPLYIVFATIVLSAAYFKLIPENMIGGFGIILTLGMFLGPLGQSIPIFKDIGGPAILCLLLPSVLVYYDVFNSTSLNAVHILMKEANFLYFVIASLVVGSILGMNRTVLIQGLIKMFIPLVVGTLSAVTVGIGVGMLFGYSAYHTFFYIIVPIIAGGVGEGILPLSLAFSSILGGTPENYVAQLIPAAVIGNIIAIICAGVLVRIGNKNPAWNGNGMLVKSKKDNEIFKQKEEKVEIDFKLMGTGVLLACTLFIFGGMLEKVVLIPGAVLMILVSALVKYANLLPKKMEQGAHQLYKLVSTVFIWPVMIGLGMLYIPLKDVVAVISIPYIIVCASVVISMTVSGFFIGKFVKMYPVESAIVTCCHSGLGGTGDVAILSASNRMGLMPFAQISTRIGGASTVILASILLRMFS
ncbi:2-hydroxycarboxylate transporter family protein [Bacillus sp. ISL-77]|uniref:2-hydroxycarboxylate transporter family protein n=1 Tax=Bacillus sp. ISL-77 TaxID=2819138 RepID=UPI0035A9A557